MIPAPRILEEGNVGLTDIFPALAADRAFRFVIADVAGHSSHSFRFVNSAEYLAND